MGESDNASQAPVWVGDADPRLVENLRLTHEVAMLRDRLVALERERETLRQELRRRPEIGDRLSGIYEWYLKLVTEAAREREEDRQAIRDVNLMTWDAWREKHAATIQRVQERP